MAREMQTESWKREVLIAVLLFGVGFFVLPLAIYWVGQTLIGEYAPNAGPLSLAEQIWTDVLAFKPAAWILVFSPYIVLQLARLVRRTWRTRSL
jgi:hypothetical protein